MDVKDKPKFKDGGLVPKSIVSERVPDEPPPVILYRWTMLPSGQLYGEWVENHPVVGTGPDCITSKVIHLDEALGIAKTRNTVYILRDKKS